MSRKEGGGEGFGDRAQLVWSGRFLMSQYCLTSTYLYAQMNPGGGGGLCGTVAERYGALLAEQVQSGHRQIVIRKSTTTQCPFSVNKTAESLAPWSHANPTISMCLLDWNGSLLPPLESPTYVAIISYNSFVDMDIFGDSVGLYFFRPSHVRPTGGCSFSTSPL